jgi:hypothetical protein
LFVERWAGETTGTPVEDHPQGSQTVRWRIPFREVCGVGVALSVMSRSSPRAPPGIGRLDTGFKTNKVVNDHGNSSVVIVRIPGGRWLVG